MTATTDKKLILAGRVILRAGRPPLDQGAVLVAGDRIVAVGPAGELEKETAERIDLGHGATLLPGLIDCHNHLYLDASVPNWPAGLNDTDIEHTLRAIKTMAQDLASGVTTARCLGDKNFLDLSMKKAVAAGRVQGPRLVAATRGLKASHGHGLVGYGVDGAGEMRRMVRENIRAGADFIKIFVTGTVWAEPIHPYLSRPEIEAAVDEAHRVGLAVSAHCIGGEGFDWCLEAGVDVIEHGYFLRGTQIEALARSGRFLVLTPSPQLSDEWSSTLAPDFAAGFRRGRAAAAKCMTAIIQGGVRYAVGTDGLHGQLWQDIQYLVELGASEAEALAAATIRAAELCGLAGLVGALEPGQSADLLAVSGDPLEDIAALGRVKFVLARGRVVQAAAAQG